MKFAIAGAGSIATIHARAIKTNGGKIKAVDGKFTDKVELFARKFRINQQLTTVEKSFRTGSVDGLIIGTPNSLHASQAVAAHKAGIAVMVEKPMATNSAQVKSSQ